MRKPSSHDTIAFMLLLAAAAISFQGVPAVVPAFLILPAAALALLEYGRRGGGMAPPPGAALFIASPAMHWAAISVLVASTLTRTTTVGAVSGPLAVIAIGAVLLGVGVRRGLVTSGGGISLPTDNEEWRYAFVATLAACVSRARPDSVFFQMAAYLVVAAILALGFAKRPTRRSPMVAR